MLILSRKTNESIVIDGRIRVKIVRVEGDVVKLGVEAPADVPVHRQEVYEEIQRNNQEALTQGRPTLPQLSKPVGPGSKKPIKGEQAGGTACALL
ncbi:MAG: carbon storage regulator CsrA [Verrucomicrobiota bacterium]|jgi:carbon storage regulator